MNCSNCGTPNVSGERFCKNCGCVLNNVQQPVGMEQQSSNVQPQQFQNQQPQDQMYSQQTQGQMNAQTNMNINSGNQQQMYNNQNVNNNQSNYGNLDPNYVQNAVNPNMKKWAILSVVVPGVGMIWYRFIGLSFYLAILIAAAGFGFAQKGDMANKKLSTVGKVLNGMLCAMAIIMFILQLINAFAQ